MTTQRLSESVPVVATAAGTAVFTFPAPPTDLVWEGTLICAAAPVGALFTATLAGAQWCAWAGQSTGGPVQAFPGEQVQVTANGLVAGTQYVLQWIGRSDSLSGRDPTYPATNSAPASVSSQAAGSSFSVFVTGGASQASATDATAGTKALLGTPPAGQNYAVKTATFDLGASATSVRLVGHSTGFVYAQSVTEAAVQTVPLEGQIAAEALDMIAAGGGGSLWITYDLTPPPVAQGGGPVPVTFQLSHSYAVPGVITAQTLPPFFVPVIAGQTAILEAVRCQLQSGTSVTLNLQQNGVGIPGLGAVSVTSTPATTNPTAPVSLSNNDAIQAALTAPTGSPTGLTISIYVQYT